MKTNYCIKLGPEELAAIANDQARGLTVAVLSVGRPIDIAVMRAAGIDLKHVLVAEPDTTDQALEIVSTLRRSRSVDVTVIAQSATANDFRAADELIAYSRHRDRIEHDAWSFGLEVALLERCDDHTETPETCEFWGVMGGDDWRVHLIKPLSTN